MTFIQNRNPRFPSLRFSVTINFHKDYSLKGISYCPSHYGTSMEIPELTYQYLEKNRGLWENKQIKVETTENLLSAMVTHLYQTGGKYYISLKLMDGLHWFSGVASSIPKYVPAQSD